MDRSQSQPGPRGQFQRRCIPLGCLRVKLSDTGIDPISWSPVSRRWFRLVMPDESEGTDPCFLRDPTPPLPLIFQHALLKSLPKPDQALVKARWILMSFRIAGDDFTQGILRVYLLPDDMDRGVVDRSDGALRKKRLDLMSRIDFASSTWAGYAKKSASPEPLRYGDDAWATKQHGDVSLVQMFNTIPSPNPRPEKIDDKYAQDAACTLLYDEDVPGLNTRLYDYQRRSATLMLQRESQPEKVVDPRLVKVKDQNGEPWYYDRVNGVGFNEPRYYDGVNGGILAEEMGAGKTLICLSLILMTKHQTSQIPPICRGEVIRRPRIGSLADMAAAHQNQSATPWKPDFGPDGIYGPISPATEPIYPQVVEALRMNPGHYYIPAPEAKRTRRSLPSLGRKVYLSYATLVVVPNKLLQQWKQEIAKHCLPNSLRMLVVHGKQKLPPARELIEYDIILYPLTSFAALKSTLRTADHPLLGIHFKRCIIDEGHIMGTGRKTKTNVQMTLEQLLISARWVVTGTPSKGLFGVDQEDPKSANRRASDADEMDDLKRIGTIAKFYLRARPWTDTQTEYGDKPADWDVYVMQPKHSHRSKGRKDTLRATMDSLIVRHQLHNIRDYLPAVKHEVKYLEGSYQDLLSLNLFSMLIIFNAVQSQRTGLDYFFHARSRPALNTLVSNLRQASFFGGIFNTPEEIMLSVETAQTFLRNENRISISQEDQTLIEDAIAFGHMAAKNDIKQCSSTLREIPVYVENFPGEVGDAWSVDQKPGDPVCTNLALIKRLQEYFMPAAESPETLRSLLRSEELEKRGKETRMELVRNAIDESQKSAKTQQEAKEKRRKEESRHDAKERRKSAGSGPRIPRRSSKGPVVNEDLARTRIISTASAKMTYLIDQIMKYQEQEQIIVFFEDNNTAWYVAYMLEILQIPFLIYMHSLKLDRKAQYINTFNLTPTFRVMLMELRDAATGLDMQSASRIYFINPVLDLQIEAQAIGRARRASRKKLVTVETLVLVGSLEEVIIRRKQEMTQTQQRDCKSILDDKPIAEWIKNAKIHPLPRGNIGGLAQTALLPNPLPVFMPGFGRPIMGDEGLIPLNPSTPTPARMTVTAAALLRQDGTEIPAEDEGNPTPTEAGTTRTHPPLFLAAGSRKRTLDDGGGPSTPLPPHLGHSATGPGSASPRPPRRVRFE